MEGAGTAARVHRVHQRAWRCTLPPPLEISPLLLGRPPPWGGGGRTTNVYHSITVQIIFGAL